MKKIIALAVLLVFCGSVCYAAEAVMGEARDPITATCEVVAMVVQAPFVALFGPRETETPGKDVAPEKQK